MSAAGWCGQQNATVISAIRMADFGTSPGHGRLLNERALQIHEARLSADLPDTARSRRGLAGVVAKLESRQ
jgi:hypothetical protein